MRAARRARSDRTRCLRRRRGGRAAPPRSRATAGSAPCARNRPARRGCGRSRRPGPRTRAAPATHSAARAHPRGCPSLPRRAAPRDHPRGSKRSVSSGHRETPGRSLTTGRAWPPGRDRRGSRRRRTSPRSPPPLRRSPSWTRRRRPALASAMSPSGRMTGDPAGIRPRTQRVPRRDSRRASRRAAARPRRRPRSTRAYRAAPCPTRRAPRSRISRLSTCASNSTRSTSGPLPGAAVAGSLVAELLHEPFRLTHDAARAAFVRAAAVLPVSFTTTTSSARRNAAFEFRVGPIRDGHARAEQIVDVRGAGGSRGARETREHDAAVKARANIRGTLCESDFRSQASARGESNGGSRTNVAQCRAFECAGVP